MGTKESKEMQYQFWTFMDKLSGRLGIQTRSHWAAHKGGNRNLAGLVFSDQELSWGFAPPRIGLGRG